MTHYKHIQVKLKAFVKKYYRNEIIKGMILFVSFGLLYFLLTLLIEYFFWLQPFARTILFWTFILIECMLLGRFVVLPISKLVGLRKGISDLDASLIIGRHFKEIDDKLVNILQLKNEHAYTDLLEASIEQKSKEIQPVPFRNAIEFKSNKKYLKYLLIPLLIWGLIWITGNNSFFNESLNRVVHHQTAFVPPAPFEFVLLNESLETVEESSFELKFKVVGDLIPEQIKIHYSNQEYYIKPGTGDKYGHTIKFPTNDMEFYFEGNGVASKVYRLKVIPAPKISDFRMELKFPKYLNRENEIVKNTGNARVPVGTEIKWKIRAKNAATVDFYSKSAKISTSDQSVPETMVSDNSGSFSLGKVIDKDLSYVLKTSSMELKDFEELAYDLTVIKDEFPRIVVNSDLDSVSRGPVQFLGHLSDDYGLTQLQVVAENSTTGALSTVSLKISEADFQEFYYLFPEGLVLNEGTAYEIYFVVFDNDEVSGPKKSISKSFLYRNKTRAEEEEELLKEQKKGLENLEKSKRDNEEMEKSLEEISKKLKSKEKADWNDQKELDNFLQRQKQYREMMEKNANKMLDNLEDIHDSDEEMLNEKKEALEDRWEELKNSKEKDELLKELEELAEKLEKENLIEKIDEIKEQRNQEKRSLERILELTKQFYVEKKSVQIAEMLEDLIEKQESLSTKEDMNVMEQEGLNQEFDSIQKEFKELRKQNQDLKEPMNIYDSEADEKLIDLDMKEALESLEKSEEQTGEEEQNSVKKSREKQKTAAKRMEELKDKMKGALMSMEAEGLSEDIDVLRQILKNLLTFSHQQEALMIEFEDITAAQPDYPVKLKEQIKLKEYFEHIDDSLYSLSLRRVELSSSIEKDLAAAHFNLDKSLEHIAENRIQSGRRNQRYTMTAANNLTDLLSEMLNQLQNQQKSMGKGQSGQKEELSLPDIIREQKGMTENMENSMQGKKEGEKKGKEETSGEQFELYQQQKILKDQLRDLLDQMGSGNEEGKEALKQMEELERILLEKGITTESLERMKSLEHELLELENATLDREKDIKRKATRDEKEREIRSIKDLDLENFDLNEDELLKRERLELSPLYQERVKKYFELIRND